MSVFPLYLVLGSDGTIGAYAREDILRIDLAQNLKAGQPARQVYELEQYSMSVTYRPAPQFNEFTVALQDLCQAHQAQAMVAMFPGRPETALCGNCQTTELPKTAKAAVSTRVDWQE